MNRLLSINCLILVSLPIPALAQMPNAEKELEAAARNLAFYGQDFDANPRPERLKFLREQNARLTAARDLTLERKDVVALLKHRDARVRTLAADWLSEHGHYRALPDLVALAKDDAETFPTPRNEKQTVGQLVRRMVDGFMMPAGYQYGIERQDRYPGFDDYWAKRKDRTHCASWFYIDLRAATRRHEPKNPAQIRAVKELRRRIDKLAEPERTFTLLWLRYNPGLDPTTLASDEEMVAACKKLGPDTLLKMLRHEVPSNDPDLQWRTQNNTAYIFMIDFVLRNATQLLRAKDADELIAISDLPDSTSGPHTPKWYIAAIELQGGKVKEVLAKAAKVIERKQVDRWSDAPISLARVFWKRHGDDSRDFVVRMFYRQQPRPQENRDSRGGFLQDLSRVKKPADGKLIADIIADPRFDTLEWEAVDQLARLVNAWHKKPVIPLDDLNQRGHPLGRIGYGWDPERARKEFPREMESLEKTLATWRQAIRASLREP
jgi:hypothetical protein